MAGFDSGRVANLRVAMLGWEFPPFFSGGLGTHCYELTRALSQRGIEIDFFMPKTVYKISEPWLRVLQADFSLLDIAQLKPGVLPVAYGGYCGAPAWLYQRALCGLSLPGQSKSYDFGFFDAVAAYNLLARLLVEKMHRQKPYDLVHVHDWICARAGISLQQDLGLPLVCTIHSTEYDRTADLWPFDWIVGVERELVQKSDQVIAVSRRSAQLLSDRLGASWGKVSVIYNAIDASKFPTRKERVRAENGKEAGVVLYHGRLSVQKGVEFFLRAAQKVLSKDRSVKFLVSGKGDMLPRLVEMTFDLGISGNVVFLGHVSDDQLKKILCASDVLVLPSVSEPFGIVALESMASGTPTIVSKTSGVSERVKTCLTVDFWDTDEIASKILSVLAYRPLYEQMRENSIAEAGSITWDEAAQKTIDVYGMAIRTRFAALAAAGVR
jgi:glycosyltransferase involved in cell wall biosynthesis